MIHLQRHGRPVERPTPELRSTPCAPRPNSKTVDAIVRNQLFNFGGIGTSRGFDAVPAFGLEQRVERLGEEPASVECEDVDCRAGRGDGVGINLILDAGLDEARPGAAMAARMATTRSQAS